MRFLESSFSGSLFVYFAMKIINEDDVKGIIEVNLVSCSDFLWRTILLLNEDYDGEGEKNI